MSNEFPAFIKAEYVEGDAFSRFQRDYEQATQGFRQKFAEASQEAQRLLTQAISLPRNNVGSLDLGVPQLRAAAEAQQARAIAAREVANATAIAAKAEGDYSAQARAALAATQALAREEEEAARAARAHADAAEQVQRALNLQKSATDLVVQSTGRGTTTNRINTESQRANRFAMIQAGQQLQDITVSLQSGQRATTVFAQQLPQLAFAFTDVGGKIGQAATFLAGPWGAAILASTVLIGGLVSALESSQTAMSDLTGTTEANILATKALSDATAALDEITGRLKESTDERRVATALATDVTIRDTQANLAAAESLLALREAQQQQQNQALGDNYSNAAAALRGGTAAQLDAQRQSVEAMRKTLKDARASLDFAMAPTSFAKFNERRFAGGVSAPRGASRAAGGGGAVSQEARDAERAVKELESKIAQLESRFDPATKAAKEFAEALRTIKDAEGSGLISERESFDLQIKAMAEQYGEMARIQRETTDQFMRAFEPQQLRSAAEEYADYLEQKWEAAQSRAANAFVTAVETADFLSALFRGRVGARDVFRLINPNDRRIRDGVSGTASGIDRFLYGKTSNFREIAEGKPAIQGGFIQSYTKGINDLKEAFAGSLEKVLGKDASKIGGALGKAFAGAEIGGMTSDLLEGLGVQNSKLGSQIGGAIGSAFGPIGSLIGSVIGGLGVEALKPAKRGSATIGGSGGNLIISSTRGNSQSRIKQSTQTADEAITTLERIAQALGGTIDASRGAVSIGVRDKNFRVDTTGRGITKTKKGAVDFGDDSAAAIRFATLDLIQDGVVQGIRASTQRILQSGKDLESAIQKAVDFQSVFDRLQERVDPVGAAITRVEKEFTRLRQIFGEAAASAEEYADLEKLYQLERQDAIKEANERVLGSMKALLDDLRFGDNGRSLRDRLAAAQAKFDPLAARVQAGDITAYDDFAEAARALLDIQRQFSGSQTAFFELQDKITAITAKVVEGGNVTSILAGSTPTAQQQAQQAYDGSAAVVSAIDRQTQELARILTQVVGGELRAINDNVAGGPITGGRTTIPGFFAQEIRQI